MKTDATETQSQTPLASLRTCGSLGEVAIDRRRKVYRDNFVALAKQRIDQCRDEHLLKVDHMLDNILLRTPQQILEMNVREFARSGSAVSQSYSEQAFEPPRKKARREERPSQEAFYRKVRKALHEADKDQEIFLPGSGRFVNLPEQQKQSIIDVLSAVVSTYTGLLETSGNSG